MYYHHGGGSDLHSPQLAQTETADTFRVTQTLLIPVLKDFLKTSVDPIQMRLVSLFWSDLSGNDDHPP